MQPVVPAQRGPADLALMARLQLGPTLALISSGQLWCAPCLLAGVSEVGNMAYMTRLGLWGAGSAFPTFTAFLDSMKRR